MDAERQPAFATSPYTLKRSSRRRRSIELSVDPVAGLVVAAPAKTPEHEIDALVRRRARWVRKALQDARNRERHLCRAFVTGETLPYLGRSLPLSVVGGASAARPTVELAGARLEVRVAEGVDAPGRRLAVRAAVERWYRRQAEAIFSDRTRLFAPQIGVRPARIAIKAQKTRWGSCGKNGALNLNWVLVMAPLPVLDYLVVHELCHLRHPGHGARFWKLVSSVLPDYQSQRAELRRDGWRYRID